MKTEIKKGEKIRELLEKTIETNIRKGDEVIIQTKPHTIMGRFNGFKVEIQRIHIGEVHYNRYGESKKNPSSGPSRLMFEMVVIFQDEEGSKWSQVFTQETLLNFEPVIKEHPRRKKSPFAKYLEKL